MNPDIPLNGKHTVYLGHNQFGHMNDENENMSEHSKKRGILDMRSEVLTRRYLMKDEHGNVIETPEQMFRRVAHTIAAVETKFGATDSQVSSITDQFYKLMANGVFLPNSPTLMNAGRKSGSLSGCFVLPLKDSVEEIFETVKNTAIVQKEGGGTGYSLDELRPRGDTVRSSGGTTSGPISFGCVLSETTNAIQQGAFRRGANMGMMSVDHPDVLSFIHAKLRLDAFTNFNISVKLPDSFMDKLQNDPDTPHIVTNPRDKRRYLIPRSAGVGPYSITDLVPAEDKATTDCYTVKQMWELIVANAHATGEPGVYFTDRVNQANPTPSLGRIEATNPCGEQPLLPYEACNLGSINVGKLVTPDKTDLNWESLAETVKLATRFLDNVIEANHWPVQHIREMTLGNRKIGLGIMGFADALILLGIRYDSEEAVALAEKLACFVQKHAHDASEKLAAERGKFPNWAGSTWDTKYHRPMRNATCTTIAPTGSISIIAGCNGGIEPVFSIVSKRNILDGEEFVQLPQVVEDLGAGEGWLSDRVRGLLNDGVSPKDIPEIPKRLADVLVTAHEISPEWHVRIQAAFQKYTDNAVSKTVNLPSDATLGDVDRTFRLAYELGCKGITVYRDDARPHQAIAVPHKTAHSRERARMISPRPRVHRTKGETTKFRMGCGTLFVTVNKDDNGLCEVFANLGKAGGCPSQSEATCRVVSAALRSGVDPRVLVEQLKNIRCPSTAARRRTTEDIDVLSCPDAIAKAIEGALDGSSDSFSPVEANVCPDCGLSLHKESGCLTCVCGYSRCG